MGFIHPPEFTLYTLNSRQRKQNVPSWVNLPDEKLLDFPMKNLRLNLEDTGVTPYLEQLCSELKDRRIRFRPHFWLSY